MLLFMSNLKVLIVEDEPVIAENIAYYLNNNDFTVSGIAYDFSTAREELHVHCPDAVLLDINLGSEEDGVDLAAYINEHVRIPLVFLTSYSDKETLKRAKTVESGGYLVKPFDERSLVAALEIAIANFARKTTREAPKLLWEKFNRHLLTSVSRREFQVLELIYQGKTNQQIADDISVSVNTVKKHINSSYLKLDVTTRTQAIVRLLALMTR